MEDVSIKLHWLFGSLSTAALLLLIRLVQKKKLDLRHALLWFVGSVFGIIFSAYPQLLTSFSQILGFKIPANALLSLACFSLFVLNFLQNLILSQIQRHLRTLTQKLAILENQTHSHSKK